MGLNEAGTRAQLIDPALHAKGWTEDLIRREETAGEVQLIGGTPRRGSGRADYVLRLPRSDGGQPTVAIALIEAKPEDYEPGFGLQQAKDYATRLHVPFVYSSNGHRFVEYDASTGMTQGPFPMEGFPGPEELRARYESVKGFSLDSDPARPLLQPYHGGESRRRYYQDAAIRAVLEKTAAGGKRALLTMATGCGKTYIAVHLLRKYADAGHLRRALFVCDRDELRQQALVALQEVFGADAAAATTNNPEKNARIVVATYQTLGVAGDEDDATFLTTHYPENYFSHIVIDEAHRSAWNRWSQVLTRNLDAIQIGLTATPREFEYTEDTPESLGDRDITADNIRYFGEPVYDYSIAQAIEDGYLAAMEIHKRDVFLEHYAKSERVTGIAQEDLEGKTVVDSRTGEQLRAAEARTHYDAPAFEASLIMPDRVAALCRDLFDQLCATGGPEQKTVIFCASDHHADAVANEMNNLHAQWRRANGLQPASDYAFKCTAAAQDSHLADFKGSLSRYFIAATVDLLSTGVDVPSVRNIVFFRYVTSPIAFYQMVGRGTRIDPVTEKLSFRVFDYTNATRLFGETFKQRIVTESADSERKTTASPRRIVVAGVTAEVSDAGAFVLARDDRGVERRMPIEEYKRRLVEKLLEDVPALDGFLAAWVVTEQRKAMLDRLPDNGASPSIVRNFTLGEDYDLYDVLADAAYGQAPKTRADRADAFAWKNRGWLDAMPEQASAAVQAIASQFAKGGTENLENTQLFKTPELRQVGGIAALGQYANPAEAVHETKLRMFRA